MNYLNPDTATSASKNDLADTAACAADNRPFDHGPGSISATNDANLIAGRAFTG